MKKTIDWTELVAEELAQPTESELRDKGGFTRNDLMALYRENGKEISDSTAYRKLKKMEKEGSVYRVKLGQTVFYVPTGTKES